mgnify:CR=1 FL=1
MHPTTNPHKVGDTVYIATGEKALQKGEIIHMFKHWSQDQLVVEVQTIVDPILYVRQWYLVSDSPEADLYFWRRIGKQVDDYVDRKDYLE